MNTRSNVRSFLGAFTLLFGLNTVRASVNTLDVTPETSLEAGFVTASTAINTETLKSVTCHGDPATDKAVDDAYEMGAITYAQLNNCLSCFRVTNRS